MLDDQSHPLLAAPIADAGGGPSRRDVLQKVAAGTVAAWVAPTILSVSAAGAATVPPITGSPTFVVVGNNGLQANGGTSVDGGSNFSTSILPGGTRSQGVAYDGVGTWIAVGPVTGPPAGFTAWTSTDDGATWTAAGTFPGSPTSVTCIATNGAGRWVAGGAAGGVPVLWFSTNNGASWTASSSTLAGTLVNCVATNGTGVWVAGGTTGSGAPGGARTWQSADNGVTWTPATVHPPSGWQTLGIATNGTGLWVATGQGTASGLAWRSVDNGATWGPGDVLAGGPQASSITTDKAGNWVAAGQIGGGTPARRVWYSSDNAVTWNVATFAAGTGTFAYCIATDLLGDWVIGCNQSRMWRSVDDGATWAPCTTVPPGLNKFAIAAKRLLP